MDSVKAWEKIIPAAVEKLPENNAWEIQLTPTAKLIIKPKI